jgi:hypothetical protein
MGPFGALSDSKGDFCMTNPNIARPDPLAAVIVFGKPSSPDLPQASWFKAEDIPAVKAAAGSLKFSFFELRTEAEKALAIGVHEGVLKGSGRMIIGSVAPRPRSALMGR